MSDRPILFSAPMIRAMLDGRKTQTRRVLTAACDEPPAFVDDGVVTAYDENDRPYRWPRTHAVGDRLWVRENILQSLGGMTYPSGDYVSQWTREKVEYLADEPTPQKRHLHPGRYSSSYMQFRPSIHMSRWASRLTLLVTEVRIQRLQEISEGDAIAEGVTVTPRQVGCPEGGPAWEGYPREDFANLWRSINGPDAWHANPWVAAYTFTVHAYNIDKMVVA